MVYLERRSERELNSYHNISVIAYASSSVMIEFSGVCI